MNLKKWYKEVEMWVKLLVRWCKWFWANSETIMFTFFMKLEMKNIFLYWVLWPLWGISKFIWWILIELKLHILKNLSEMSTLEYIFIFSAGCLGLLLGLWCR